MKRKRAPKVCPVCGEDVPPNALACPECGSCHNSGWKEDAEVYDGLDLPDDEFDDDEHVKRELGTDANPAQGNMIWWVTGFVVLLILLLALLRKG